MQPLSNLVIAIAAEVLFLAVVVTVVWLVVTRRQLLKERALRVRRETEISTLRQRLQRTHQHLHAANERIKQLESTQRDDQVLSNYQQRITNLEKFKELYFELEEKFAAATSVSNSDNTAELDRYKQRAQELEATEARLQTELTNYRRRLEELQASQSAAPAQGAVRLKEMEDLNDRLQQREKEIRHLRQECETIGLQYEELATKSLSMAGMGDALTEAQKAHLEELKQKLEENAAALERKQAECDLLENYYLELEESTELTKAAEQMQQSDSERDALQEQRRELGSEVESAVSVEAAAEMATLRQALADKEAALNEMRENYREIKEQFVEVSREESAMRSSNEALKQEAEKLRQELSELSATRDELIDQQKELEKMRSEYSKMESRYLALAAKTPR